jgi:hypothetical protein
MSGKSRRDNDYEESEVGDRDRHRRTVQSDTMNYHQMFK